MIEEAVRARDLHRAALGLEEILDDNPEDHDALRQVAAIASSRGEVLSALAAWEALVLRSPEDPSLWLELARARFACAHLGAAMEAVDRTLGTDPRRADALYLKGMLLDHLHASGEHAYQRAFFLNPIGCPLPLQIDDPELLVRRALRQCDTSPRTHYRHTQPLRLVPFASTEALLESVPPRSPQSLCVPASFDDDDRPHEMLVCTGNLRFFDDEHQAADALTHALHAEYQEDRHGYERP